eukprot:CAMPEP_0198114898 /NCGR_PEP_ID=MMETSP1442-20131203/6150_1 /TAXON_ID= /ORGANISM="Craspedostauros australis, Strain CCMP3328" /LENGTH=75 /DNA_ID=CAMNT_0043772307 /DNA_START=980 /DNA_END=1204 /DNA_ORIENTATION=-
MFVLELATVFLNILVLLAPGQEEQVNESMAPGTTAIHDREAMKVIVKTGVRTRSRAACATIRASGAVHSQRCQLD